MNGVIIPTIKGIKYGYVNKAVTYAAGTGGYDSITVPTDINIDNFIGLYLHMSSVGNIQGLQITPCFVNGAGDLFYNYYAPSAVNTTLRFQYVYEQP